MFVIIWNVVLNAATLLTFANNVGGILAKYLRLVPIFKFRSVKKPLFYIARLSKQLHEELTYFNHFTVWNFLFFGYF